MLQENLVRTPESLELGQPDFARAIRNRRLARYGFAAVVLGLSAAAFFRPHAREPDFTLILKGFSETLEELPAKPADDFVESLDIPAETACGAEVRDCFSRLDSMDETVETNEFRETLELCLVAAVDCVASVEVADAQRANENATMELASAISLLRGRNVEPGMELIVSSFKSAADAIGKQFPEVARLVKSVIVHVMKLLEKYTPVVVEHAKKLGGFASEEVQKGFDVLKEHLPTLIRKCKCGASYAGREVSAAAERIRKELPRLQHLAIGAERNATIILNGLLANVPRLVETCKSEIAKAKEQHAENFQKIQGALVVAAALGGGLLLLNHHNNEVNALDVAQMQDANDELPVFYRLSTTDYTAIVSAYDAGRWEELGRTVGFLLQ
jgi:hypothetical protein